MQVNTSAIIIDDEVDSTQFLESLLKDCSEIKKVSSFNNPVDGLEAIQKQKPELLFLDLNMPQLSGLEILRLLNSFGIHIHVVVITAYTNMILKAAHCSVIDYLHKPFALEDLKESLNKYKQHKNHHKEESNSSIFLTQKIRIPTSFEELFFSPEEISYLEADGAYTQIYLANDTRITSSYHLGRIQDLLPSNIFYRISRKHIINYSYLFKIDKKSKKCMLNHQVKYTSLPFTKSVLNNSGLLPD